MNTETNVTEQAESKHYAQRLKGKLEPTQGGSVYVDPESMEWQPSQFEKISMKVLYRNDAEGEMTVLLKWEPGAVLPFHRHPEIEQSYVLQGSFYDHDGICRAGQYVWRHPGSLHETHSDEGCILLAVYRKPNVFFGTAGFQAA
ncbi:cupin domain-containing protein [Alcaligenes sp. SORT26]|uniref:cupin domain-containing protein n=1 Tax=Alcaligenes sp. SORT26 TaxID=2813780 RepID=UPI001A9ED871|nr:cupin domain-containing protein [Alcaligenes sp. SORT26]QTC00963.1 cupin domain-containing protein [Alcaligenes sp. SORT26]